MHIQHIFIYPFIQRATGSGSRQQKQARKKSNKEVVWEPIKRSGWIEMCPPHLFVKHCIAGAAGCLWQAQIRACGALCLSVIEAGYTTVWKQGDMTYIFLLSAPQTLSGLLPPPHTRSTQLKHISQSSHVLLFFLLLYHVLGKWSQSPKSNIDRKCCVKCLLVCTAQAIKCNWLFWGKWHTNVRGRNVAATA